VARPANTAIDSNLGGSNTLLYAVARPFIGGTSRAAGGRILEASSRAH